ncbi:MAG: hypothetical protein OXU74_17060 [Gemmatimonadota bacterium]|nr:hypothetical protein [Gemmatimonadota bacterium]
MKRGPTGRASVEILSVAWRKAKPAAPDDPSLDRTPRTREITGAQIVQSIFERGIE